MDTITTIPSLLKSNGSAQPVTVALMPNEARLIAAAPDMLEALKAMVLNDRHTYRDCHKAALAAIAKAEGRSHA